MKHRSLWPVVYAAALITALTWSAGCQSPQVRAAVSQARDQAEIKTAQVQAKASVDTATADAAGKVADAQAKAAPLSHPMDSANLVVKETRSVLVPVLILATVLTFAGIGLSFVTALSWVSRITIPITGCVAGLSFLGVLALPFMPWAVMLVAAIALGLFIYELVRERSVSKAVADIESDFGYTAAATSSVSASISKTAATVAEVVSTPTAAPVFVTHS